MSGLRPFETREENQHGIEPQPMRGPAAWLVENPSNDRVGVTPRKSAQQLDRVLVRAHGCGTLARTLDGEFGRQSAPPHQTDPGDLPG